ncbi:hypothetical protein C1701_23990 [Actinoalloteichus sp. AHMU CJ021]|uniref:nucleotidyltransferase family protein n=1 Tax=Actinoalloteichus sp. AHMU CJ021 TaxID=2072503 RepID=UPI000CA078D4|nr:hypothetical protein C1701_23990 [Actinoalloteichus sp. AHMU CJ021]
MTTMARAPWFPTLDLGPEWALLELLCPGPLEGHRRAMFLRLLRGGVHGGELVEQAMRHRLLPVLADSLRDEEVADLVHPSLRSELVGALMASRRRNATLARVAGSVCRLLGEAGVPVAVTKGAALEPTVYGGRGCRRMSDVDLMIHPRHREVVSRIMTEAGYVNGLYDWREHRIAPLPRDIQLTYRLSPDHLPHYLRVDEDGGVIAVDFANSLTWAASDHQVDMDDVLGVLVPVRALAGEVELPTLAPRFQFLFTALHLFRESWFEASVERGNDRLLKFADLLRLWRADHADILAGLPEVVVRYDLGALLGWVLVHTDRTFGTSMAEELGVAGAVSEGWLASARAKGGRGLVWTGTMRERLHARDRQGLFAPAPAAPVSSAP